MKLNVRKRGNYYEYRFEMASIDGTRKWATKSEFNTKEEALEAGAIAFNEYITACKPFKEHH